jgi:uncharacterized membrane protein
VVDGPASGGEGTARRASLLAAATIGVGLMAAVDEIVFHQLLAWHHFYDGSSDEVALLSDGLLHAAELVLLVGGFFWFADLRRRRVLAPRSAWAGAFLGLGAFQVFDGVVNHKVLGLHEVRYGVEILPYDVAWVSAGLVLLLVGVVLAVRSRGEGAEPAPPVARRA